ncbi:hypothetical protein CHLRE_06g297250v5 [Chlamydomonas reinhardtii]|uniref:Uncharacterized protein n=1 Tax=Chlamydomonas reinhardtii TaxID=3055 RepID=A0A2K3DQT3_CHLRE|nr:uncharacterized protein CHLRE_06g297250v5 [Chlamydomonas reinhardtii]PNW82857.1 hypothetical protein CHLRE_06g297250v5 [Chlamydomonas reinhardtii]
MTSSSAVLRGLRSANLSLRPGEGQTVNVKLLGRIVEAVDYEPEVVGLCPPERDKQREAVHLIVVFEDDPETCYTVMVYQVQHFADREDLKRGNYILLVRPFALLAAEKVMSWKPAGTSDTCLGVDCCLDRPRVLSPGAAAEEFPHQLIDDTRLVINSTPLPQMQPKAGYTGVMWVETVEESRVWDGSAVVTVVTGVDGTSSAQLLIMPSYDSTYEVKIKPHMPLFIYCAMCTATPYGASGFRLQLRPGPCASWPTRPGLSGAPAADASMRPPVNCPQLSDDLCY